MDMEIELEYTFHGLTIDNSPKKQVSPFFKPKREKIHLLTLNWSLPHRIKLGLNRYKNHIVLGGVPFDQYASYFVDRI